MSESETNGTQAPGGEVSAPPASPPVEAVRNSPEYQELQKQNRLLARQLGSVSQEAKDLRARAEQERQAAEAQRVASLNAQIQAELGPEGVAFWDEFASLSATDPVAAAKRLAEFRQVNVQSAPTAPATIAPATTAPATLEGRVTNPTTPPLPSRGVDTTQPLGSGTTGEDLNVVIEGLERTYSEVVKRNQDINTRNRVTMRDRAAGMISFLGAAYLKSGVKPKSGS